MLTYFSYYDRKKDDRIGWKEDEKKKNPISDDMIRIASMQGEHP